MGKDAYNTYYIFSLFISTSTSISQIYRNEITRLSNNCDIPPRIDNIFIDDLDKFYEQFYLFILDICYINFKKESGIRT